MCKIGSLQCHERFGVFNYFITQYDVLASVIRVCIGSYASFVCNNSQEPVARVFCKHHDCWSGLPLPVSHKPEITSIFHMNLEIPVIHHSRDIKCCQHHLLSYLQPNYTQSVTYVWTSSLRFVMSLQLKLRHHNDQHLIRYHMSITKRQILEQICKDGVTKFCKYHGASCSYGAFINTAFCHMFVFLCPSTKYGPTIPVTLHIARNSHLVSSAHTHYYRWLLRTKCRAEHSRAVKCCWSSPA
jgi:hypothetical protein